MNHPLQFNHKTNYFTHKRLLNNFTRIISFVVLLSFTSLSVVAQCPVIITQPVTNQTVCSQGTHNWSVVAEGTGLSYRWEFTTNGTNWFDTFALGQSAVGGNTANLQIRGITNTGLQIRVIIHRSGCSTTSNSGSITVLPVVPPITISSQTISFTCPQTSADITSLVTNNIPVGNSIIWRSVANNSIVDPTQVTAGTYYPTQFNGTCYSTSSSSSWVTVTETTCQLPVTLISFQGEWTTSGTNELSWATTEETSNEYFEIQASINAKSFETIGRSEGKGTSSMLNGYKFIDQNPFANLSYYRLKQVDFDGTSSYSKIITVKTGMLNDKLITYPNPATDKITIKLADQVVTESRIVDLMGRSILIQKTISKTILTTALHPGIYVLEVQTQSGQTYREQFVKQ